MPEDKNIKKIKELDKVLDKLVTLTSNLPKENNDNNDPISKVYHELNELGNILKNQDNNHRIPEDSAKQPPLNPDIYENIDAILKNGSTEQSKANTNYTGILDILDSLDGQLLEKTLKVKMDKIRRMTDQYESMVNGHEDEISREYARQQKKMKALTDSFVNEAARLSERLDDINRKYESLVEEEIELLEIDDILNKY